MGKEFSRREALYVSGSWDITNKLYYLVINEKKYMWNPKSEELDISLYKPSKLIFCYGE